MLGFILRGSYFCGEYRQSRDATYEREKVMFSNEYLIFTAINRYLNHLTTYREGYVDENKAYILCNV